MTLSSPVVLAPMAGVADNAFRLITKSYGASLVFSELVSADGLVRDSRTSFQLMRFTKRERPFGIQLFGNDPDIMGEAAKHVESLNPDVIDLNFGCPVKKVVKRGAGAALLNDPGKIRAIVRAVVSAVKIPVSGKIRSGWQKAHQAALDASRILEEEGAAFVTVHPRTQKMGYSGQADWNVIQAVRKYVSIPVVGNGDVVSPQDAKRMLDETSCDLVMIGRGALGRPWLFRQVNHYLGTGELLPDPSSKERIGICLEHYDLALQFMDESKCVREMRKHIGWYLKGLPNSSKVRQEIFQLTDKDRVKARLREYADELRIDV